MKIVLPTHIILALILLLIGAIFPPIAGIVFILTLAISIHYLFFG